VSTPSDQGPLTDSVSLGHASRAYWDARGVYHWDADNQPLAQQEADGLLKPADRGQQEHISRIKGYCEHGQLGGCSKD